MYLSELLLHLTRWDRKVQNLLLKRHGLESSARKIKVFRTCLLHWEELWSHRPQGASYVPIGLLCYNTPNPSSKHCPWNVLEFLSSPGSQISTLCEDHPRIPRSALLVKATCQHCLCPLRPYEWWHALLTCGNSLFWPSELWASSHSCFGSKGSNLLGPFTVALSSVCMITILWWVVSVLLRISWMLRKELL